jgi:acyl carrier protein
VAIMNDTGGLLTAGERGEIAIRGAGVTRGYENNAEANNRAFVHGWFRTGDEGYLDNDGYLFITGRLKEIINRGGEKIMPREIYEVLMDHPAVAQATTFAMPDKELGEDVGAAVVLRAPGITEQELRRFAAQRLAYFKVPRRIVFLDEIPKGPTGKIQRIGLAEQLGLMTGLEASVPDSGQFVAPRSQVEEILTEIWCKVLNLPVLSVNQRFLDLGGDSVQAARVVARLRQRLGIDLSLLDFFEAPTIAGQAVQVQTKLLQQDSSEDV